MLTGGERGEFIGKEAKVAAIFKPGHLVEITSAGEAQKHSVAAGNSNKAFALASQTTGGTIDDAYAVGEVALVGYAQSGQLVNAVLAAAAPAIVAGDALESAGNGTLRKQVVAAATTQASRDSVVGYADESVDNSGGGSEVRIIVRVA